MDGEVAGNHSSVQEKYNFQRTQPKVFCIGLNKTGTTSFGEALRILGYRRHGWRDGSGMLTMRACERKFQQLFTTAYEFDAFEDLPWPLAFAELDQHFPNAKFVLTLRASDDVWLESIGSHIRRRGMWIGHKAIYGALSPDIDAKCYRDTYNRHNEAVRKHFAGRPGKLLEMCFEHGDGWKKICPFLGIPEIPKAAFPHANARPDATD